MNTSLNVACRGITSLKPYENMINLETFDCWNNQLTSLKWCPPNIKVLTCYQNQIKSLKYCPKNLKNLICSFNQLASLRSCPKNLEYIWCPNNKITSLKYLPFSIKSALFCDNPLSSKYKNKSTNEIHCMNFKRKYNTDITDFSDDGYEYVIDYIRHVDEKLNKLITVFCLV